MRWFVVQPAPPLHSPGHTKGWGEIRDAEPEPGVASGSDLSAPPTSTGSVLWRFVVPLRTLGCLARKLREELARAVFGKGGRELDGVRATGLRHGPQEPNLFGNRARTVWLSSLLDGSGIGASIIRGSGRFSASSGLEALFTKVEYRLRIAFVFAAPRSATTGFVRKPKRGMMTETGIIAIMGNSIRDSLTHKNSSRSGID